MRCMMVPMPGPSLHLRYRERDNYILLNVALRFAYSLQTDWAGFGDFAENKKTSQRTFLTSLSPPTLQNLASSSTLASLWRAEFEENLVQFEARKLWQAWPVWTGACRFFGRKLEGSFNF